MTDELPGIQDKSDLAGGQTDSGAAAQEKMRKGFEKEIPPSYCELDMHGAGYYDKNVQVEWEGYQRGWQDSAARSAETIAGLEEDVRNVKVALKTAQGLINDKNAKLAAAQYDNARLREALNHVDAYLDDVPHGDNCFVSNHYEGDPGNRCNCGKDAVCQSVDDALAHPLDTSALDAYVANEKEAYRTYVHSIHSKIIALCREALPPAPDKRGEQAE